MADSATPYIGRKVRVTLRALAPAAAGGAAAAAAGAGADPAAAAAAAPSTLEADLFAVDGTHGLAVFRNAMATTYMKADYFFLPLERILRWEDLGEGEKVAVPTGVAESVLRQRYEASCKRAEEQLECRSDVASELEMRLFMELRKTCVRGRRGARPAPPLAPPPPPITHAPHPNLSFSPPHRSTPPPTPTHALAAGTRAQSGRGTLLSWTTWARCCTSPTLRPTLTLRAAPSTTLGKSFCSVR
jgi:hypothetical protein